MTPEQEIQQLRQSVSDHVAHQTAYTIVNDDPQAHVLQAGMVSHMAKLLRYVSDEVFDRPQEAEPGVDANRRGLVDRGRINGMGGTIIQTPDLRNGKVHLEAIPYIWEEYITEEMAQRSHGELFTRWDPPADIRARGVGGDYHGFPWPKKFIVGHVEPPPSATQWTFRIGEKDYWRQWMDEGRTYCNAGGCKGVEDIMRYGILVPSEQYLHLHVAGNLRAGDRAELHGVLLREIC